MARYAILPDQSTVWIDTKSSLHPIHSVVRGVTGFVDVALSGDGSLDLSRTPEGHVELEVDQVSSGNPLYDREMKRRAASRQHPTIAGDLSGIEPSGAGQGYTVRGTVTFKGVTREYEDTMTIVAREDLLVLEGAHTFDVRDFGLEPPKIMLLKVYPDVAVRVEIVAKEEAIGKGQRG